MNAHSFRPVNGVDVCSRCGCERRIGFRAVANASFDAVSEYRTGSAPEWVRTSPPCSSERSAA